MGIDACIAFKATGEIELERDLPPGFKIVPADEYTDEDSPGATHEVDNPARYYGEGYERGDWPRICSTLMLLHACPAVEKVWYGGDCYGSLPECTPEDVVRISLHFMKHGERPYRGGE